MFMSTISVPKTQYQVLKKKADFYDRILSVTFDSFFSTPPIKNGKKIISEFKKTKIYNKKFLESLNAGLKRSSFFN